MKKTIFSLMLVLLLGLLLVACKNDSDTIILKYYGKPDEAFELSVIEQFESLHENVKVEYTAQTGGSNEKLQQIQTVLQSGSNDIDVFAVDATWPSIFIAANWVADFESIGLTKEFLNQYMLYSNFVDKGKTYGIPFQANAGALYYRTDLLEKYNFEAPTTWEELKTQAATIMAGENDPNLFGYAAAWQKTDGLTAAAMEHFWGFGVGIYENGELDLDQTKIKDTLAFMKSFIDEGLAPADVSSYGAQQRDMYKQGKLVFARGWATDGAGHYFNAEGNEYYDKTGVIKMPNESALGNWGLMISKHSKHKEVALEFIKFRTSKQVLIDQNKALGAIPPLIEAFNDEAVTSKLMGNEAALLTLLKDSKPRPLSPFYGEIASVIQNNVHSVITGVETPEKAAEELKKGIEAVFK
jgi:multiple sugar transport system substrate-binding protein